MKKQELKKKIEEYKSLYIKKSDIPPARLGKSLYISKEHHERISQIISVIGRSEITLYEYVNNVLTEHFSRHFEEIAHSFKNWKIY
jgi:hypothetical protein